MIAEHMYGYHNVVLKRKATLARDELSATY